MNNDCDNSTATGDHYDNHTDSNTAIMKFGQLSKKGKNQRKHV